jgi:hypothetical protein
MKVRRFLLIGVAMHLSASIAWAQPSAPDQDPLESMPFRFGPMGLSPTLSITEFGVDSNVFNDPVDPRDDFTMTIVPRLLARLRSRYVQVSGSVATGFVYFHEFDEERSINFNADVRGDFELGRFRPYVSASFLDTHDRLNAELDIRAPRTQTSVAGGARVLVSPRTGLVFNARHSRLDFEEGSIFEGVPISQTMNSTTNTVDGGLEFYLTPLTTLTVTGTVVRDRFEQSPERNADSFEILPTLKFDAPAIIQGTFMVGYRRFEPDDPILTGYTGVVARGSLTYSLAERTKFDFTLSRDVQYSFELADPYYIGTGLRLTVTQQLNEYLDVRGTLGFDQLAYRTFEPVEEAGTDRATTFGAGVGYRFRPNLRVGVDVEYAQRTSDRAERQYDRTRVFGSVAYGL